MEIWVQTTQRLLGSSPLRNVRQVFLRISPKFERIRRAPTGELKEAPMRRDVRSLGALLPSRVCGMMCRCQEQSSPTSFNLNHGRMPQGSASLSKLRTTTAPDPPHRIASPFQAGGLATELNLLGKSVENVWQIEIELNAGRWVFVDGHCARKHLVNAGFVEQ